MSDSLRPHGLEPARLLCPWDSPGKNTEEGCCAPPPGDLPKARTEPRPPASAGRVSHPLSRQGSPYVQVSLVAQMVKGLPTMQETRVRSLGQEESLEETAPHSSTLAWKIPWTEEPGRLQSTGSLRVGHD